MSFSTARAKDKTAPPSHEDGDGHTFRFMAMACPCEIRIHHPDARQAFAGARSAIAEVRRIERKYSRYRASSVVSRINHAAGRGPLVTVDAETASLLQFATQLYQMSEGLFDATSGVLRRAWDFRAQHPPTQAQIDAVLPLIGWDKVTIEMQSDDGNAHQSARVALTQAGMELDFGGFGKEYATDRAATLLQEAGVQSGLVNLGGDLRVLGPLPDGSPWTIAIAHPRAPEQTVASMRVHQGAMATSGDYERFITHQGQRYCHILNPLTGWPVQYWQSVSVAAPLCVAAGAMSTIAMLQGQEASPYLQTQNVSHLLIDPHTQLHRYEAQLS